MKKLLWVLAGALALLVVAAIAVPLFVSVDRYRPLIQSEVNKRINGRLELGALSLSLWGTAKVHAESVRLSVNGFAQPLVDTRQFHLELPLWGLVTGSPRVTAVLKAPKVSVVKVLDGRTNAFELMKPGTTPGCVTAAVTDAVQSVAAAPEQKLPK